MYKNLNLIILWSAILTGCISEIDHKCPKIGMITGTDMALCVCCGGYLVDYNDTLLRFYSTPDDEQLEKWIKNYGYPIKIAFDFTEAAGGCAEYHSEMICMELLEHNECSKIGQIINYNSTKCYCCPGWIIAAENDTIKILNLPIESEVWSIVNTVEFPISIKFDYVDFNDYCENIYKKVTCIEIID